MAGFCPTPVEVIGSDNWGQAHGMAAGSYHTCSLNGTTVRCWGLNDAGEVGSGGAVPLQTTAVPIGGADNAIRLIAGAYHGCYAGGSSVYCWGSNLAGQLGGGTQTDHADPVAVASIADASVFRDTWSAGSAHTCGIGASGMQCAGDNASGQLGDGSKNASTTFVPVTLANAQTAVQVSAGWAGTCAVTTARSLQCWGAYPNALGPDSTTPQPMALAGNKLARQVRVGFLHTCALTQATSSPQCWGDNSFGELGIGSTIGQPSPAAVPLTGIDSLALGPESLHTCALAGNIVYCWGANFSGQIGDGTTADRLTPAPLSINALGIAVGAAHTCARLNDGPQRIVCWGDNAYGQLGNGEHGYWPTPDGGVFVDRLFTDGFGGDGAGQ